MGRVVALIPCFNEAGHLEPVILETAKHVDDVLVYDDGSSDGSLDEARRTDAIIEGHEVNQGKGMTLRHGLDWAVEKGYEWVITLDADGQHDPTEIPLFKEAFDQYDLIIGNRMSERKTMPIVNWYTNVFTSGIISWLAGQSIHDSQVGYRAIRTSCWKELVIESNNFEFEGEMLVSAGRKGFRIGQVPIATIYGDEKSKINPVVDTWRFFRMVWRLFWTRSKREIRPAPDAAAPAPAGMPSDPNALPETPAAPAGEPPHDDSPAG